MSLPEFSIHRPVTVIMACLMAVLLGGIAFVEIPVDLMPETEYPTLSVNVGYPGVAPQEMETLVARPLEQALAATPGVEEITFILFGRPRQRPAAFWLRHEPRRGRR
ncbi:MAG: efflux RND transporter permease subunit [Bryobacterales bacterium]